MAVHYWGSDAFAGKVRFSSSPLENGVVSVRIDQDAPSPRSVSDGEAVMCEMGSVKRARTGQALSTRKVRRGVEFLTPPSPGKE